MASGLCFQDLLTKYRASGARLVIKPNMFSQQGDEVEDFTSNKASVNQVRSMYWLNVIYLPWLVIAITSGTFVKDLMAFQAKITYL